MVYTGELVNNISLISNSTKTNVSLCGHSFLPMLRTFITQNRELGFQTDLKIRPANISSHGRGGNTFHKYLELDIHNIIHAASEIVYIELGCNDLDSQHSNTAILAQIAMDIAEIFPNNKVNLVFFGEVLLRTKSRNISIMDYNRRMKDFNNLMRFFLINPSVPRSHPNFQHRKYIWFWDHLNLHKSSMPLLTSDGFASVGLSWPEETLYVYQACHIMWHWTLHILIFLFYQASYL